MGENKNTEATTPTPNGLHPSLQLARDMLNDGITVSSVIAHLVGVEIERLIRRDYPPADSDLLEDDTDIHR